jgi:hypothetical protein
MRNLSETKWNAVLSRGAHEHACCCYSIKFVRLESISWRNESRATSRTWHVFPPTLKICNKIPIDIPHTCAWCVTSQKRNETLFCLVAHINMHAVAIRSSLYGLNRFLDEMGVAQHRAHGTFSIPQWKFVTNTVWHTAHLCMMRNLSKTQWNAVLSCGAH